MREFVQVVIIIFLCFNSYETESICDPITQQIQEKSIIWNIHYKDTLYRSSPLCLDENLKIISRKCEENQWDEEPQCWSLQKEIQNCPENFEYYKEKDICYIILKSQSFPPKCPFVNVMGFFDYMDLFTVGLVEGPVWFPAKTIKDYGIGNMVIIEPTKYYGDIVSVSLYWKETFNKQCLVYKSYLNFEPVYCTDTYDYVCAYKPLKIKPNNICSRKLKKECSSSDFVQYEETCFCKQEDYCGNQSWVQFQKPYQSIKADDCNFGLINDENKILWGDSEDEVLFTNWNEKTDFDSKQSFGIIQNDGTWVLQSEKNPKCSLCREELNYNIPKISMKINEEMKRLVLTIDHINDLYLPEERKVPFFCFSDTNSYVNTLSLDLYNEYETINETRIEYYLKYSDSCPGHYWCEAFELPSMNAIQTGKVLVFDEEYYGNEYSAILVFHFNSDQILIPNVMYKKPDVAIIRESDPFYLRWITVLDVNEEENIAEFLVHITSKTFRDVQTEYFEFSDKLNDKISNLSDLMKITELKSVSYCLPDDTTSNGILLHWPLTKVNATAIPDEFCLQEDGSPVFRGCFGDFLFGAEWMPVNGSCAKDPVISPITTHLYNLLHNNITSIDKIYNLLMMTRNFSNYLPVDIYYIAEIIEETDKDAHFYLEGLTRVIDNVVNTQKETLKTSQDLLNSTDKLLYNFDVLVENFYSKKRSSLDADIITKNIKVHIFDANLSNTSGIAIYDSDDGFVMKKLYKNTTMEFLLSEENLTVATYIPEKLLHQISENLIENQPLIVSITVFLNDYLFNQDHLDTKQVAGNIFGILLPALKEGFEIEIPIIYKSIGDAIEKQCSYWHYGSPNEFANIKGKWEFEEEPEEIGDKIICSFGHTTHFALLVFSDFSEDEEKQLLNNYKYLHVVTSLGCGLSIFGILGILVTAVLFKPWRSSKGNQILVQYSIVTLIQICLLYAASNVDHNENRVLCVILGAALHYDVLCQFCWMLVMAILHYQRFVLVFKQQNKWIVLKSCVIGYAFPLVPVITNVCVSTENYAVGSTGICYPTGQALYIWLLVPVGCIVLTNLTIFCVIVVNIFRHKFHDDYGQDYIFVLKLRLVIVLFSTLGITWIFGFAAEIFNSILCTYLFCLTASLQGFIIFLAFIVFNATTRRMYWFFMKALKVRVKLLQK